MAELVPPTEIERIVGARRHPVAHIGRAVSAEETVYILHSQACLDRGIDLRKCSFSLALDRGIDLWQWRYFQDRPVRLTAPWGVLLPVEEAAS